MILYLTRINKEAIVKYRERSVRIFCVKRQLWLKENGIYCILKDEALLCTFEIAIDLTHHYTGEVEYHFIDKIGDFNPEPLSEFDEESVYNNIHLRFDKYSRFS